MNTVTASVRGENLKNLGVKCNSPNNWVFRPGEFQAENESELTLKSESSAWNLTLRKTRRDAISDETKRIVYDFWLSPVISHPTGNKPDIKRERLGPNSPKFS
jgi:hypothetical protein